MTRLLLATRNAGKLREITRATADANISWVGLAEFPDVAEVVEDGETFVANSRKKALEYSAATGLPALADDSGLEVDCLNGEPGVHSAYYADLDEATGMTADLVGAGHDAGANNRKLVAAVADFPLERRTARFRCHMAFAAEGRIVFETDGAVEGLIVDEACGDKGFGYDPHFFVPALNCTLAELSMEQKNRVSHRGIALRAMLRHLKEWVASRPPA